MLPEVLTPGIVLDALFRLTLAKRLAKRGTFIAWFGFG